MLTLSLLGLVVAVVIGRVADVELRQADDGGASTRSAPRPAPEVPATPPVTLWSESFRAAEGDDTDESWEDRSGVVAASRTNAEVVPEGPSGRDHVLRITFEEDSRWGADYRHAFDAMGVEPQEEVHFSYDVYFEPEFEFIGDGKMGGLAGIRDGMDPLDTSAGGSYDESSFSVRAMWREDRSVVMYLYARHGNGKDIDDRGNYGYGITKRFVQHDGTAAGVLEQGRWHRIEHRVVLNTPGENDGLYEMWIDGYKGISVDDIQYRTADHEELRINQVMTAYFFGGGEDQFPTRENVAFTDEWALTDGYRGPTP
ncbi:polysaccharide lyase [Actinotalea ferrariae]|uniref:polysaccharide lyase n=1 Tax=Actinotalea ferrariae TaxID=1386098 RepID=UPI0012DBF78F|nr:hypothetical protein [Actinotalea ferrariae]